ncbi:hypothetical protein F1C16_16355 [Hymenobacter sp. NBH84]|uniref:hypothetical protein n=1 Tax=Hymenobacter sp. NBH84 TaxID=2596915 RepID=UPI001623B32A|nr:hypothetical protein [Hymenobacter sp. NBH84]QNE41026.1 hypothetical protein F1C16_16355 [Hymenobacter sp. NBH84]
MMKAFLWGCGLVPVLLLAGCQSEQKVLLPETTAYSSPCPSTTDSAFTVLSTTPDSTALLTATLPLVGTRSRQKLASARAQFLATNRAPRALQLARPVTKSEEITQIRRARRQPFRLRHPQDETEGNPWLVALGVVLVAAGIVGGLLIGGGIGVFAGIVVGLLGYYFFMRGLLGPHAWLEAIQELFQL